MIRISLTLFLGLASLPLAANAQSVGWDGSFGAGSDAWRAAVAGVWRVGLGQRITLGAGGRLTYYGGQAKPYRNQGTVTAALPARLSLDPAVLGLNAMVMAELHLLGPVGLGANVDLAGLALGPTRNVGAAELEPARGSLFLYGNNDRGSLNSEFYATVSPGSRVALRAGVSHYIVGYRGQEGSDRTRYLRFDTVPFLAIHYRP